jgi:hypothetical protein
MSDEMSKPKNIRGSNHGHYGTRTYKIWSKMIERCNNPNHVHYKNYGGRGISVCKEWRDFRNFLQHMGVVPDGLEIDRIDNDKGYFPGNCHWVTRLENARNKRSTRKFCHLGKEMTLREIADFYGVRYGLLNLSLFRGQSFEEVIQKAQKIGVNHG